MVTYTNVVEATDVTPEIVEMARNVIDGFHASGKIEWDDVWYRMESYTLEDGSKLDLGTDADSPAIRKLKRLARRS